VKRFWETMDRWRVFHGVIIIVTVLSVPHVHGVIGYTALVISAMVLIVLYSWWRRRGIFRRTT
jgi:predicted ferric reductase